MRIHINVIVVRALEDHEGNDSSEYSVHGRMASCGCKSVALTHVSRGARTIKVMVLYASLHA